ncbi:terpene synthase family protein [Streptomyces sp. enrichment culture]|uniref:terpene synthase family protein n=1 Tax=Streptomyces sp. enrichment culture TaxID=1795815 RepID=UPI003F560553
MPFDPSVENPLMAQAAEKMWGWAYGHGLVRDRAARERMERTRPELWAALCYTTCDLDTLALLSEWVYWGFALDDEFDEGGHDVQAARACVGGLDAVLHGGAPRTALEAAFADLLARSCPGRSAGWVHQFRYGLHRYVWTLYSQTADRAASRVPTVAEFVDLRRDAIAMNLYFDLHEIDAGIDIPQPDRHLSAYRELRNAASDYIWLHNDIGSLEKEVAVGDLHNAVYILHIREDKTLQEAVDASNVLLGDHVNRILTAEDELTRLSDNPPHAGQARIALQRCAQDYRRIVRGDFDYHGQVRRYTGAGS